MKNIITLTHAAVTHIKQIMSKNTNAKGFRLSIKKTGCSGYAYVPQIIETITASDLSFMTEEGLAVYVDQHAEAFVRHLVVDYVAEDIGGTGIKQKRLVFINPNEKNRCGCGESFTIE